MSDEPAAKVTAAPSTIKDIPSSRTRSPDLSRLLSISAIMVALAVAGSFLLEDMMRSDRTAQSLAPERSAEVKPVTATPVAVVTEEPVTRPDASRVKRLEKRIDLLERQIVLLQQQALAGQRRNSSFQAQLTAMEMRTAEAEHMVVATATVHEPEPAIDPAPIAVPKPAPAVIAEPATTPKPVRQAAVKPIPEPVIGISTKPAQKPARVADVPEVIVTPKAQNKKASPPKPILTGSIPIEKITEKPNPPAGDVTALVNPSVRNSKPARVSQTRFALKLALFDTVDGVRTAWKKLKKGQHAVLADLEPRALPQGTQDGKLKYRLLVGPISNAATAAAHCAKLARHGVNCRAGVFGGEVLDTPPSPGTLIRVEVVADPEPQKPVLSAQLRALIEKAPRPQRKPKPPAARIAK